MTNEELINLAIEAKKKAITPTNFLCGAAIETVSGEIYTGCNLGSKDGIFNICAEQVAICKMLSDGKEKFTKIAVVGGLNEELTYTTPCGVCRQLISTFGKDIEIICGYTEEGKLKEKIYKIEELLPETFSF